MGNSETIHVIAMKGIIITIFLTPVTPITLKYIPEGRDGRECCGMSAVDSYWLPTS